MKVFLTILLISFLIYIVISSHYKYYKKNKKEVIVKSSIRKTIKILPHDQYFSSLIKNPNSKIDSVINSVFKISQVYLEDEKYKFIGQTELSILKFEEKIKMKLPNSYKQFLRYLGAGNITIFDSQDYSIQGFHTASDEIQQFFEDLEDQNEFLKDKVVFSCWQGYEFFLFSNYNYDDPKVYYMSLNDDEKSLYIFEYTSFSNWLLNLTLDSLILNQSIEKHNNNLEKAEFINKGIKEITELIKNVG